MNEDPKDALMKKYQQEIEELKRMLEQPDETEDDEESESGEESEESDSGDVVIGDNQSHTSSSPQKTEVSQQKSSPEKSNMSPPSKTPGAQDQTNGTTKARKVFRQNHIKLISLSIIRKLSKNLFHVKTIPIFSLGNK